MQALSLVVITYNEEQNIKACIDSALGIATEIIVLDSMSTDNTQKIVESLGGKFHKQPFAGHIQQKNKAKDLASQTWILSLDADERLSPELLNSIKMALSNPTSAGYCMNRLNHYAGRAIKTCGWYPDKKLRLWKKDAGEWIGINPHDKFELHSGNVEYLAGDILHYTYSDFDSMKKQVDKFALIAADLFKNKPYFYLTYKLLLSGVFKFIRTYFFQRGFTDGKAGFEICFQQSREVFLKYYLALKLKFGPLT
jgi:glycosyltransferase involved in cell wall biosynthesis